MAQIKPELVCDIHYEEPKVDIFEEEGFYIACITLFDTCHNVGPACSREDLYRQIADMVNDIRTVANIKTYQNQKMDDLRRCLLNMSMSEKY